MIATTHRLSPGFMVLLCLFNCALLLHLSNGNWYYPKTTFLILLTAGLQLLNYRLVLPVTLSIIACTVVFLPKLPRLANHFNLEIVIGMIILGFMLFRYSGSKKHIAPLAITLTMRCSLIAIYFIAGFHKLNSGFFNNNGSCASYINLLAFNRDVVLPQLLTRVLQIATIIIEMVLPFGLLHYKLRKPTVCVLVLFHAYLALCGFANFSAFAAFLLAGSVINLGQPNLSNIKKPLKIYIACCIVAAIASCFYSDFPKYELLLQFLRNAIFSIGFIILFKTLLFKMPTLKQAFYFSTVPVISVLLLTLWGMQGYFGLSTARSFNMYSNLITEKTRSNHYLINTRKTKIWNFEEDVVSIVKLPKEVKWENAVAANRYDIPLIEFKTMAKRWSELYPEAGCTIIYKGKVIFIPNLKRSAFSKTEWWHRFLFYRMIPQKGVNECMW